MKKIISLMLSVVLVSAMAMPAFANDHERSLKTFCNNDADITLTVGDTYDLSATILKEGKYIEDSWTVNEETLVSTTKQVGENYESVSEFVAEEAGEFFVRYDIRMYSETGNGKTNNFIATNSIKITVVDPIVEDIGLECAYVVDITEKEVVMVPVIKKGVTTAYEVTLFVYVEYSDGNFEEMSFYKQITINKGKNEHITATVDHTCDEEDCSVGSFSKKFEIVLPS